MFEWEIEWGRQSDCTLTYKYFPNDFNKPQDPSHHHSHPLPHFRSPPKSGQAIFAPLSAGFVLLSSHFSTCSHSKLEDWNVLFTLEEKLALHSVHLAPGCQRFPSNSGAFILAVSGQSFPRTPLSGKDSFIYLRVICLFEGSFIIHWNT